MSRHIYQIGCIALVLITLLGACRPDPDSYIYGLREVEIETFLQEKRQAKTMGQYIAVLHSNLFQRAISPAELQEIEDVMAAMGDKSLAKRMVISTFLRKPDVFVPTMREMREDTGAFVHQTYLRFLQRAPTQSEKVYLVNFINSRPQLEPHIIYTTFALSDEYQFY